MSATKNMIGQTLGRLTGLSRVGSTKDGKASWLCRCSCGTEVIVSGKDMRLGHTRSCGCLERELLAARNADPEFTKRRMTAVHQSKKWLTSTRTPEKRQHMQTVQKISQRDPKALRARSENMRHLWSDPQFAQTVRAATIRRNHLIANRFDTKLELAVKAQLDSLGVHYEHPFNLHNHFLVDFYLPDTNTIIEADGCYWHGCKPCGYDNGKDKRTRARNAYIRAHGYKLIVVPEHEAPDFLSLQGTLPSP